MLPLALAMGTLVWAVIGYALLQPNPPAPIAFGSSGSSGGRARVLRELSWVAV